MGFCNYITEQDAAAENRAARITTDRLTGTVTIVYIDAMGERRERVFTTTGRERGSVIELLDDDTTGRTAQVCERLSSTGYTLNCSRAALPDVIRREYRRMRRAEGRS